jgi:hypothetical protein
MWRDVMLFREIAIMSRWLKEEPLSVCGRQSSIRHKLKSFMFLQWKRSSELQLLYEVDSLYQDECCVNTDASYLSRNAALCHLYELLLAFKIYFVFGRFLCHSFHDTAKSHAIEGIWFIHHSTGWFPKRKAILGGRDFRIYRRTWTFLPWHYNSVGLSIGNTAVTVCSLPLWRWKLCILPTENIYGLCILYVSKINRLDFVVKGHCVFCEIGPGILNINDRNFGFESVTLLLRCCFFLIWLCAKEICGGVPITLSVCPC